MKLILVTPFLTLKGHFLDYTTKLAHGLHSLGRDVTVAYIAGLAPPPSIAGVTMLPLELNQNTRAKLLNSYGGTKTYYTLQKLRACNQFYKALAVAQCRVYDIAYHLDYEYIALMYSWSSSRLSDIATKHSIWVHSASAEGSIFYSIYKSSWFAWLHYAKPRSIAGFVVNGNTIADAFSIKVPSAQSIETIAYPGDRISSESGEVGEDLLEIADLLPPIALCFGIIRGDKNVHLSAQACIDAGISVAIVGFPKDIRTDNLERLTAENPKRVVFVPRYVTDIEIDFIFKQASVCIMCYDETNVSQSGPLALARAYKVPAVVSKAPELSAYVRNANVGTVAEQLKRDSISKAITEAVTTDYETSMDKAAEYGTWSSTIKRYDAFFKKLAVES